MTKKFKLTIGTLLIAAVVLLAQQAANIYRVLPATNTSGVPVTAGELRFLDLTNPASATPKYWGFKAPASLGANHIYTGPNGGTGCWSSDGSDIITLGGCPLLSAANVWTNINTFDSIYPVSNLVYSMGDCAFSATCPSGSGAKEWAAIHVQSLYNYSANPMSFYSDTTIMALDTHAAQPIQFYTTNTLRGQWLAGGALEIANLAGSGTRCVQTSNVGDLSAMPYACLDPTVANTISGAWTFSAANSFTNTNTFSAPQIFDSVYPASNLVYSLGDCAFSATCPSGSGAKEWAALHVQSIYNFGAGAMAIYSDTTQISIDTHGNQPIQFYTTNTLRGQFTGAGVFQVANLGGGGTRCPQVDNSGNFSAVSCPTATGTVTSVATSGPITGGTITTSGTIGCSTCAVTNTGQTFSGSNTFTGLTSFSGSPAVSFSGTVSPAADNTYSIGGTSNNLLALFVHTIYDYTVGTALGLYANSSAAGVGIAITTGTSADIVLYPNAAAAFTVKGSGAVRFNNLAGHGTGCAKIDNNGEISWAAAGTC